MRGKLFYFSLILGLSTSLSASEKCKDYIENDSYSYRKEICDDEGNLLHLQEFFKDNNKLYSESFYKNNRIIKKIGHSSSGDKNYVHFSYTENSFIKTYFQKNSEEIIKRQTEYLLEDKRIIKEWRYKEGGILDFIDSFTLIGERALSKKEFPSKGLSYHMKIDLSSPYKDKLSSFDIISKEGEKLGSYRWDFDGDLTSFIERSSLPLQEKQRRIQILKDKTRRPIAIIDSGFDLNHPELTYKFYSSSHEAYGDIDHDQNGLAGDAFGWRYDNEENQGPNINEKVIIGSFKPIPLSHGTHVASIALKDHENFSLLGYAGDVSSPRFLEIVGENLRSKNVLFANMSWGFKESGLPMTPTIESYHALKELIYSTPKTLFFVAAGNTGMDLDHDYSDYPASYSFNNTLVVGALNTSDYHFNNPLDLIPAIFNNGAGSNTGYKTVDVFAPGKKVNGAKLGGGMIRLSGTSMASPLVLNTAMEILTIAPQLDHFQVKEIILKSVAYTENDLPCLSRGIVNPKRAKFVAKILFENPEEEIEDAILTSREKRELDLYGEVQKMSAEMLEIWQRIDSQQKINRP